MLDKDDRRVVRRGAWYGARWVIAVVVFVGGISIGLWGFGVFTAEIKGRGEAHKQRESAGNRIFQQQHFEDAYQAIQKDVANITAAEAAYKRSPTAVNEANVTGTTQICNADVAEYNANAEKFLAAQFRREQLPNHIDIEECSP